MTGTVWHVERVVRVVDGDSLRVLRSRIVDLDGQRYQLSDAGPDGVLVRLAWVDTPERGDPAWHDARRDLIDWIDGRPNLSVVVHGGAGWDRLLVDLIDPAGESASQWLMSERGWPPYVER